MAVVILSGAYALWQAHLANKQHDLAVARQLATEPGSPRTRRGERKRTRAQPLAGHGIAQVRMDRGRFRGMVEGARASTPSPYTHSRTGGRPLCGRDILSRRQPGGRCREKLDHGDGQSIARWGDATKDDREVAASRCHRIGIPSTRRSDCCRRRRSGSRRLERRRTATAEATAAAKAGSTRWPSTSGKTFATVGLNYYARVFETEGWTETGWVGNIPALAVAYSPDDRWLLTAGPQVVAWDIAR